jgi:hypothetical protein
MSHGLTVMAPSGFLSRLTKCAESQDLRLESLDVRKATLAKVLARAAPGLRLNQHMEEEDGRPCSTTPASWARRGSYRSGRIRATGLR